MNRRSFLGAILAAATAPYVVRAQSLMPVRPLGSLILPGDNDFNEINVERVIHEFYASEFTVPSGMSQVYVTMAGGGGGGWTDYVSAPFILEPDRTYAVVVGK